MKKPTPTHIRFFRLMAKDTQETAAKSVYMTEGHWSKCELGSKEISLARWELYLLKHNLLDKYDGFTTEAKPQDDLPTDSGS